MAIKKFFVSCIVTIFFFLILPSGRTIFASVPSRINKAFFESVKNSSQEETIIIKFKEDSAVTFSQKQIQSFTSSQSQINQNSFPIDEIYVKKLQEFQTNWVNETKTKIPFTLIHSYQHAYNGVAIRIRGYNIRRVLEDPRVDRLFDTRDLNYISRQFSISTLSAKQAWNLEDSGKNKITGKGIRVGVLDTGIDYFHPDFLNSEGKPEKIKGGKDFADSDDDYYDSGSTGQPGFVPHGTHVAGITSGNNLTNPLKRGMAPDSDLFVYKVFSDKSTGANSSNVIAAINQSVIDKCHVINLSLGNSNPVPSVEPGNPYYDSILNAMKAGVVVVCAAGNDGSRNQKTPYPIHAPGTYEPTIQVAGSDDRMNVAFSVKFSDNTKQWITSRKFTYAPPFLPELNGVNIVDCGFGREEDFAGKDVKGKIALISRGPREAGISFQLKNLNAKKAGAIAAITYNYNEDALQGTLVPPDPNVDPFSFVFIPNIQISGASAFLFKKAYENGGKIEFPKNANLSMYDMSSAGPCISGDDDIFKPDVSAPGKQVNSAVMSGKDDKGTVIPKYEDWDGTSMATPHATGVIALVRQAHPEWTAFDIKAVMMNTADLIQNQVSELPFSFFYQGSGQVNTVSAIQAPMITTPPSLMRNIAKLDESYSFEIKNTSMTPQSVSVSFEVFGEPIDTNPIKATFKEKELSLAKGEKKKFTISFSIDTEKFVNRKYEGVIWIQSKTAKHHIPIILYKGKLSDVDKPITNFNVSETAIDLKSPMPIKIDFQINAGSRLIVKGAEPEYDSCSNHANTFKVYVTDAKKNVWGTIFFAENLFIGKYSFIWNGLDIYGKEIAPNGTYYVMAELSGERVTLENGQVKERLPIPEITDLKPMLFSSSGVPTPPLLLVSSPDKIVVDSEFVLELLFADAQDIDQVEIKITWSKSSATSISYLLGDFVDENKLNIKKDVVLLDGEFSLIAKRDSTATNSRLKIATIRLKADKATPKTGLITIIELKVIKDKSGAIRKTLLNYPLIQLLRTPIQYGDFNEDSLVDKTDFDLLMPMNQKTYTDSDWDPKFDLNSDLKIDITDFVIFSKYYTES